MHTIYYHTIPGLLPEEAVHLGENISMFPGLPGLFWSDLRVPQYMKWPAYEIGHTWSTMLSIATTWMNSILFVLRSSCIYPKFVYSFKRQKEWTSTVAELAPFPWLQKRRLARSLECFARLASGPSTWPENERTDVGNYSSFFLLLVRHLLLLAWHLFLLASCYY